MTKTSLKTKMRELDPNVRQTNFAEVAIGYTQQEAQEEAKRCLQCKHKPCVNGCPVNVPIPSFIHEIVKGNVNAAYQTIQTENALPAICGRVCPQERQCEKECVRCHMGEAVAIGRLERFVADYFLQKQKNKPTPKPTKKQKVAIIGSGPAGITCAGELAKKGYSVTVFEALHEIGGVLQYGIPAFRLPKALVEKEIAQVRQLGVHFVTNVIVGRSFTIDDLLTQGYATVFIGSGAGLPRFQGIPGENLNGIYAANEFLTRVNLMHAHNFPKEATPVSIGKKVCVIGGGNVAMDCARTAKRLGAPSVQIVYRRSEEELPARIEEIKHAKDEGITFSMLTNPESFIGKDGWVTSMRCVEMELGKKDSSGRRRPQVKEGSHFCMDTDTVIIAIGQSPNPLLHRTTPDLQTHDWGGIIIDKATMATSKEGVYAGGDVVSGAATVIEAMGAGKQAAKQMDKYMQKKN